jgi:hypothetical protein
MSGMTRPAAARRPENALLRLPNDRYRQTWRGRCTSGDPSRLADLARWPRPATLTQREDAPECILPADSALVGDGHPAAFKPHRTTRYAPDWTKKPTAARPYIAAARRAFALTLAVTQRDVFGQR